MSASNNNPKAAELLNRAAALQRDGRMQQSAQVLQQLLQLDPGNYQAAAGLARFAMMAGQPQIAERYASQGRRINPDGFECLAVLTQCYQASGRTIEAIDCMQHAARLQPDNDRVHFNLGVLCEQAGQTENARRAYERAWSLNAQNLDALSNLTMLELANGDEALALEHCAAAHELRRGKAHPLTDTDERVPLPENESMTSRFKLKMDHEQLSYLRQKGLLDEMAEPLIEALAMAIEDCANDGDDNTAFRRQHPRYHWKSHWQLLNQFHNRPIYLPQISMPDGPLINPQLDIEALQKTYRESTPEVVVVDDFLTDAALQAMRDFCREATIWYDLRRNYLGAYLTDGFANPLTLGIAKGLREALPQIFGAHPLTQAWGYKYGASLNGIGMHADAAAVNCNFWITEDEANMNPERGGLLVYRKQAPLDWDFDKFNNDGEAMRAHLGASINDPIRIAHRANRIVIFNSNLFHRTDDIKFKDNFDSRRYNVTLLYGRRGATS